MTPESSLGRRHFTPFGRGGRLAYSAEAYRGGRLANVRVSCPKQTARYRVRDSVHVLAALGSY